ncbi:MAG TPA: site-specific integrase [Fimbriiglobus sp.]|nr:site-specific integrase [Fimbriiglobus sp.]
MPRTPNAVPVYRRHKPTNQAVCTIRLSGGGSKQLYLGRYKSAASRAEYERVVALVVANGGVYPAAGQDVTVNEALLAFVRFAERHYRDQDGKPTGTADDLKLTLGYVRRLFGRTLLSDFGIPQLKTVRDAMVRDGRVRTQVNKRVSQVRQFVRWCVEEQLVSPSVLEGLRAVRPLAPGRSGAKEGKPVAPADPSAIEKVLPLLSPAVRAIVALLRLTGARPGEVCRLRPGDLDRTKPDLWRYAVARHKGTWRGKARTVYLGPEAIRVLTPWLDGCGPEEFVFTPARSEAARSAERAAARVTKRWPSHMRRNDEKRARSRRKLAPRYDRQSVARAISRACRKAKVTPFSAYQLRHLRAVELRERYGLETVRAVLGHSFKAMSDHYSQAADAELAGRAMAAAG